MLAGRGLLGQLNAMKLPPLPATTVFDRVSALARETGAINLGQGFPEIEHAPELLAAARRALVEHSNQYPPMRGLGTLREAIAAFYRREQGLDLEPEQIVVTSGSDRGAGRGVPGAARSGRRGDPAAAILRRLPAAGDPGGRDRAHRAA